MTTFDLNSINSALSEPGKATSGVDFSGKSLKLDTEEDAKPIVDAINQCSHLEFLTLTGNTLGVVAARAIAAALATRPELRICRWSDLFTGRMKTEIPPALSALGDGMIAAGARLSVLDLSDNAFGPIGVEGLAKLLQSEVCSELQELRLNNNGLGITGGKLLAAALGASPRPLRVFVAGRNRLENQGAIALAGVFERMGTLEEVSMPQNGIYHAGVSALAGALRANQGLTRLDLNDNTVGAKGAAAIAGALASLPRLRCLDLGDCLLKSGGARALAKALGSNPLLESVNLSHNEIGRVACMEVVEALTLPPRDADTLSRVVLAGNSLGGAAQKRAIRDRLGAGAELSDGEDVTDSEEEVEESEGSHSSGGEGEEEGEGEDSATEDAREGGGGGGGRGGQEIDTSVVEEVPSVVASFLNTPTIERLRDIGPTAAADIDQHLQSIKDPAASVQAYVEATLMVSGCCQHDTAFEPVALELYSRLLSRATQLHAVSWLVANALLRALGLIKSEDKSYRPRWALPACYRVLAAALPALPAPLAGTLRFFIRAKRGELPRDVRAVVDAWPALTAQ